VEDSLRIASEGVPLSLQQAGPEERWMRTGVPVPIPGAPDERV
jgi:hypothetical protein